MILFSRVFDRVFFPKKRGEKKKTHFFTFFRAKPAHFGTCSNIVYLVPRGLYLAEIIKNRQD